MNSMPVTFRGRTQNDARSAKPQPRFGELSDEARKIINTDPFITESAKETARDQINFIWDAYDVYEKEPAPDPSPLSSSQIMGKSLGRLFAGLSDVFDDSDLKQRIKTELVDSASSPGLDTDFELCQESLPTILQELDQAPGLVPTSLVKALIELTKEQHRKQADSSK